MRKTLELLQALNGDGSPAALDRLDPDDRAAAFSPEPKTLPVSDILFDKWALTSIKPDLPGRPPVEPYLHGITEEDQPETYVAWREEVRHITGALCERYKPDELLAGYPIKPHELLRDRSARVFDRLASLARVKPASPAWLVTKDGAVDVLPLGELADKAKKDRINFCTVLLPPDVGGLKNGALTGDPEDTADDVGDDWLDEAKQRRRCRTWDSDEAPGGMRLVVTLDIRPDTDVEAPDDGEPESPRRIWNWFVRPYSADDDGSRTSRGAVSWSVHTEDVTKGAQRIVKVLPIPEGVKKALVVAAKHHDLGKKRIVWQRAIGNLEPTDWLAKSGKHFRFGQMKPIELTDYRHEFGSLIDVQSEPDFQALDDDLKELVLHLIAAHHGFGRPHFPVESAFDPEARTDTGSVAGEVPRRFARLQQRYGRWGLAYLESLLRAADYAASAAPSKTLEARP